jgi:cytochrome c oxidase subunit III
VSSEALTHPADAHVAAHHHNPNVAHQFDTPEQQLESAHLGMWAFLATEVLFFGGLFMAYVVYRWRYPETFLLMSHQLDWKLGLLNTFILLFSSLTMALAVHAAQSGHRKATSGWLLATIFLAFGFVGVKYVEYGSKIEHGLVPGQNFDLAYAKGEKSGDHGASHSTGGHGAQTAGEADIAQQRREDLQGMVGKDVESWQSSDGRSLNAFPSERGKAQMFFFLYFCMTGLHAFHIVVGIIALGVVLYLNHVKRWFSPEYNSPVEITGLYWHFVDIVWIFLFPLLYLIDLTTKK